MNAANHRREFIKAGLRTRFGTVFAFEDAQGLPRKSVSDFLRGRTNRRVADAIDKALAPESLSDKSDSSDAAIAHRQNGGAK
ncbi:hypothetical protein ACFQ1E_08180 [Sphingomonas canadensis]|uniref:XRE family transcriptional regulator n=1 Tax=Sphingomonas canadensis TaxID=1219257 RepID=A0ABW3H4C5_9SPHN|nr:hypothetical protein [Sphingomonas canadensis]MCW3836014.1 hypothetical protein [Sphingomonas canadensis]